MSEKMKKSQSELLVEKWEEVVGGDLVEKVTAFQDLDTQRKYATAQLLENQDKFLVEDANVTAGLETWNPVLMKVARRVAPKLIHYDIMGVQPATAPVSVLFALRARYPQSAPATQVQQGDEALFDEANTAHSGKGTHTGNNPFDGAYTTGTPKTTAEGETEAWAEMGVTVEKATATVGTRQLRTEFSPELRHDMKNHGLDAETVLTEIISTELIAEKNRYAVRTLYGVAKQGGQFCTTPGTFSMLNDSDGRWAGERYKGLLFAIERDANAIAVETRRGKGNIVIVSADVASALAMAGLLDYSPAIAKMGENLQVDAAGATFAGMMGRYKVYVDPYAGGNGYMVGYRGVNQFDAGVFYVPYVIMEPHKAIDPKNFNTAIGFKDRSAMIANPFTTLNAAGNVFYRKCKVADF